MLLIFAVAATALPSPSEVQAFEETRVVAPFVSYDRKGRAFAEFAPTVETRAATCVATPPNGAECTWETRVRDFFGSEFGPWETRRERLVRERGCWVASPRRSD